MNEKYEKEREKERELYEETRGKTGEEKGGEMINYAKNCLI